MTHKHIRPALILTLFAAATLIGCSTPPIKKANKNFERAWLAYTSLRTDKAYEYFQEASTFFEEAMTQDTPSQLARHPSNRVKAGISHYFSAQYDQCIESMSSSHRRGERIWEADLFTGLAYARLGDGDNALKHLALYMDGLPPMSALFAAVKEHARELNAGGISLDACADGLETALQKAIVTTIRQTVSSGTVMPHTEKCDGRFWWRRNKQPCSTSK